MAEELLRLVSLQKQRRQALQGLDIQRVSDPTPGGMCAVNNALVPTNVVLYSEEAIR
jgi:hypothetical protein